MLIHNARRKMLIADMNDLRAQQEDASKNSMLETESAEGKKEDVIFLRIALKLVNRFLYIQPSVGKLRNVVETLFPSHVFLKVDKPGNIVS